MAHAVLWTCTSVWSSHREEGTDMPQEPQAWGGAVRFPMRAAGTLAPHHSELPTPDRKRTERR
jgi:hypothetical protein